MPLWFCGFARLVVQTPRLVTWEPRLNRPNPLSPSVSAEATKHGKMAAALMDHRRTFRAVWSSEHGFRREDPGCGGVRLEPVSECSSSTWIPRPVARCSLRRPPNIPHWVGVLFGYFLWFFWVFFMVFRSADARVSQSVKQLVSQLVDSRPSGQSVGEPTERSVSQSVGQPTERPVSQSVSWSAGSGESVSQSVSQSVVQRQR